MDCKQPAHGVFGRRGGIHRQRHPGFPQRPRPVPPAAGGAFLRGNAVSRILCSPHRGILRLLPPGDALSPSQAQRRPLRPGQAGTGGQAAGGDHPEHRRPAPAGGQQKRAGASRQRAAKHLPVLRQAVRHEENFGEPGDSPVQLRRRYQAGRGSIRGEPEPAGPGKSHWLRGGDRPDAGGRHIPGGVPCGRPGGIFAPQRQAGNPQPGSHSLRQPGGSDSPGRWKPQPAPKRKWKKQGHDAAPQRAGQGPAFLFGSVIFSRTPRLPWAAA